MKIAFTDEEREGKVIGGVEGTVSFGAGLARRLSELGHRVYEVLRPRRDKRGVVRRASRRVAGRSVERQDEKASPQQGR